MPTEDEISQIAQEASNSYGHLPVQKLVDLTYLAHSRLTEARSLNDAAKIKRCEYAFALLYFLSKANIDKELS